MRNNRLTILSVVFSLVALIVSMFAVLNKPQIEVQKSVSSEDVKAALVAKPEILLDVAAALQRNKDIQKAKQSVSGIEENKKALFDLPQDRILGNPNGKHAVAVFFDYQCPHCREAEPFFKQAIHDDPELKLVFHEFPVINQFSIVASAAAMAAAQQNHYMAFHDALMAQPSPLDMAKIEAAATQAGLNLEQMKAFMVSPAVNSPIKEELNLGRAISVDGTPAFAAVGAGLMEGWTDLPRFQQFINRISVQKD